MRINDLIPKNLKTQIAEIKETQAKVKELDKAIHREQTKMINMIKFASNEEIKSMAKFKKL